MKNFTFHFKAISIYRLLLIVSVTLVGMAVNAQSWTIALCSGGPPSSTVANTYGPMYSIATAGATSRTAAIYPSSQLAGISLQTLTNAYFHRATATGSMAGSPNFKIYLKEVSATDWGSSTLDWANTISGATLVYDDNPASIVGSSAGWKNFPFSTNFYYTGSQNLAVLMEYTNATASSAISWSYEFTSPCVNTSNNNTTKYTNVATGTLPPSLSTANYRRPYIGFDAASFPCTASPTPGSAVASPAGAVCSGTPVTLGLTGNSSGTGQTYKWQSASTAAGPYTTFSAGAPSPALVVNPAATTYYRAEVICSGGTPAYSQEVEVLVTPPMNGVYTINSGAAPSATNFQTFAAAANALGCGIAGPVIFNVAVGSGPYNEQMILTPVSGASATNTITFNGNGAVISDNGAAVTGERAVIKLNGADYVTIRDLVITTGSGTYGYGVQLLNDADNNTIANCTINNNMTSTSATNYAGILINSSVSAITTAGSSLCDNNIITGNTINGGYAGIAIVANSTTSQVFNNKVTKNIINDFQEYGIYINGNVGTLIDSNDISRPTRSTLTIFRGIGVVNTSTKTNIIRNRIHDPFVGNMASTVAAFCIYFSACHPTAGNEDTVANNLIYNISGATGNHNGVLLTTSDYIKFYHNTIALEDVGASCTTCGTRGFYMQTAPFVGLDFKNNIVTINRGGAGPKQIIYFEGTGVTFTSNNNDYYMASSGGTTNDIGFVNGTAYPTWVAWQSSGQDNASQSVDPVYMNPNAGNLTPLASSIDNIGTPAGVLNDINGATRSLSSPDPGAYEFNNLSAGLNMGAEALMTPALSASGCYTNNETVTIRVRNSSSAAINFATNPVTITTNVTGAITQTLTATLNAGTLAGGASQDVPMSTTLNMSVIGSYSFNAHTTLSGDVNTANDAMPAPAIRTKMQLEAGSVSASPDSYCMTGGAPVLSVTGTNGHASIQWQQSITSGTGFADIGGATVSPYAVSSPIGQTMYYKVVAMCGASSVASSEVTVALNDPQVTSVTNGTRCGAGQVNLQAGGSAGTVINWYAAPGAATALFTGNPYSPAISANTTYYAAAAIQSTGFAGPNDPISLGVSAASSVPISTYHMAFDVLRDLTLLSVDVYPTSATAGANASITIQNSAGTTIATVPYTVTSTSSTKQTVPLNITLAPGTGYKMGQGTNVSLLRNSTGAVYPYVSSALNIISNNFNPVYYYYFYNWQYSFQCESSPVPVTGRIDDCPMPVTLMNFAGEKQGGMNKLMWTTATEVNNAGFELERSADGRNFSKLVFVASQGENGNSNSKLDYVNYDERPLIGNGYYRLKQMDKDGRFTYSNIVVMKGSGVKEIMITSLYPNPADRELNLVITSPASQKVTLVVTDMTGKVISQTSMQIAAGDNLQKLHVSQLASGIYFIKTVCANGCESQVQKFMKQ